jgi:hypothetical protein
MCRVDQADIPGFSPSLVNAASESLEAKEAGDTVEHVREVKREYLCVKAPNPYKA